MSAQVVRDRSGFILQADIALYHSEVQFRRLLEKLPAGAYTCDPTGLITYFNQNAVKLWGRQPRVNDPVDRFCGSFKLFSADGVSIKHDECWMALALQNNSEYNGCEILVERPDGTLATVLAHANPIHDDSGKLIGAVNVLVDITERKSVEEKLKETDRRKNEFIATLAHELRNPLAPIRNAVQVMHLEDEPTPKLRWALEVIDRQMGHLTRLTDDLLDLARINSNKIELRKKKVLLLDALNAAIEISRPLISQRNQNFTCDMPDEPLYLNGDITRLAQAISNLLNNASKYTSRGGDLSLKAEFQNNEAVIRITDSGIGISAEKLPQIFEMFAQAGHSAGEAESGLGIGLTLVRRLVEMHDGTVEAVSAGSGQGSTFIVRLPLLVKDVSEQTVAVGLESFSSTSATSATSAARCRVLVVDDNEDCAESMAMLLQLTGNEVKIARNGLEAVEFVKTFQPDVAFLDIGMPKLNGYEAARRIREDHDKDLTLIAISGWGQDEDRRRSKEAGFDHHLVKPIDFDEMQRLLSENNENRMYFES